MAEQSMSVEKREDRGKNQARRLRVKRRIPGILYGDAKDPVALAADPEQLQEILDSPTGANTIFDLEMGGTGQRRPVMIHEVQRHPVRQALMHVDFIRINMEKKIHVKVHLKIEGVPWGVKNQGGILEHPHRELSLECLPGDIPREILVNVEELHINQAVRVRDLKLDAAKYRILDDGDTVIAVVAVPAAEEAAAATPAEGEIAAPTEPEVIKKGKKDEEGAEAAGAGAAGDKKPAAAQGDKKPVADAKAPAAKPKGPSEGKGKK